MPTIILLCGLYNIGFALFHLLFWHIFDWKTDLEKWNFANKAIIQILNIQLTFYFLTVAAMCFLFPEDLIHTALGKFILGVTSVFWLIRAVLQLVFLRTNHWVIHVLTVLFFAGAGLFGWALVH